MCAQARCERNSPELRRAGRRRALLGRVLGVAAGAGPYATGEALSTAYARPRRSSHQSVRSGVAA